MANYLCNVINLFTPSYYLLYFNYLLFSVPLSRFANLPGFSDMGADAEDELTDTGSCGATSAGPEQLRCWEYMLERNTRVLFDRELQASRPTLPRVGKGSDIVR